MGRTEGQGNTVVSVELHQVARELECASGLSYTVLLSVELSTPQFGKSAAGRSST